MELQTMRYEVRDQVAHVRFDRPEGANGVSAAFARDLRAVMLEVEWDDSVRAVSVTAEGKVFSGGGDLKEFHAAGESLPRAGSELIIDFHAALVKMNRLPKPFVAGVRGAAGGAGLSMVGAFDLVVSSDRARYTMAYTRAGMTPDGTSSYFIARHIGLRRMMDLTLTNRVLSAEEAEAWGLVNRVVPDEDVDQVTADLALQLAKGAPYAVGRAKRVVYEGYDASLEVAAEIEAAGIIGAMATDDGKEGIAAFLDKRDANWTGR